MTLPLTSRQERLLTYIRNTMLKLGHPPTLYEMAEAMGGITVKAVKDHLKALEKKEYLRRAPGKRRAIVPLQNPNKPAGIPIVGRVAAGMPLLAQESLDGTLPFDAGSFADKTHFALQIRGDSMTGAGILEGDYVIVRQQETAQGGDIVVALLGDEATVKFFRKRRKEAFLEAAHPAYPPIRLSVQTPEPKILGKVIGVYRIIA